MPLSLFNTLGRKLEPFEPLEPPRVRMYVCGPTVYSWIHIGNARPVVFFDVVYRYLKHLNFDVTYVMNITDIDDRILDRAAKEKVPSKEVSKRYTEAFLSDLEKLSITPQSHLPKVTDHIEDILRLIRTLMDKGIAYATPSGEVLFSVRKFEDYGKLSMKEIDLLQGGSRSLFGIEKEDPLDFSLWKAKKHQEDISFESPWGEGRPGWHIECSAMAMRYLGTSLDIHGGGVDLIHPHHENEIAQSEAASGKLFAKYWLHNEFILINNEKMSKSLGNIFLVRDFISKYSAELLRFLLLSSHYRSVIHFDENHLADCQAGLHRIYRALEKALSYSTARSHTDLPPHLTPKGNSLSVDDQNRLNVYERNFQKMWEEDLNDDFNFPKLLSHVFQYVRLTNFSLGSKSFTFEEKRRIAVGFLAHMTQLSKIVNLFSEPPSQFLETLREQTIQKQGISRQEIERLIDERDAARREKNFPRADEIRCQLLDRGIELQDFPQQTSWDVVFPKHHPTDSP